MTGLRSFRRWTVVLSLASAAALEGCGLFRPAAPEPPTESGGSASYETPSAVLATIARAVAAKARGQTDYQDAFHSEFQATFDPAVLQTFPPERRPQSWGFLEERHFFLSFVQDVRPEAYVMRWSEDVEHPDGASGADSLLHRKYLVQVRLPPPDTLYTIAVGFADLTFREVGAGQWQILRWDDRVDPAAGAQPRGTDSLTFGARRVESSSS